MSPTSRTALARLVPAALLCLICAGCESAGAPPVSGREPQVERHPPPAASRPVEDRPDSQPTAAHPPAHGAEEESATTERSLGAEAAPDESTSGSPDAAASLPKYLTILERQRADRPFTAKGLIEEPNRLVLETRNVKRLRIDRRLISLPGGRSIIVRIDNQGLEWTPRHEVLELDCSNDGVWTAVSRSDSPP